MPGSNTGNDSLKVLSKEIFKSGNTEISKGLILVNMVNVQIPVLVFLAKNSLYQKVCVGRNIDSMQNPLVWQKVWSP
jgi:hypothetical protein